MKTTAIAPSNIAFVKYWGKFDPDLRLPLNDSLSMNTDQAFTTTTVEFSKKYTADSVEIIFDGNLVPMAQKESQRVIAHIERIRQKTGCREFARIVTKNSFPMGVGVASSASGFAALTVAACGATGSVFSERELTVLARIGSGSACRSIPDGFVVWKSAATSEQSYAYSVFPQDHWNLVDTIVFVDTEEKKVSSSDGMEYVRSSPFWKARVEGVPSTIKKVMEALQKKDIDELGSLIESDAFSMHAVMMTQSPPVLYWSGATIRVFRAIWDARTQGIRAYCTVDAGANVHVICEEASSQQVVKICNTIEGVIKTVVCRPAPGAHIVDAHLF